MLGTAFNDGAVQPTVEGQPLILTQLKPYHDGTMFMETPYEIQKVTVDNEGNFVLSGTIYFIFFVVFIGALLVYLLAMHNRNKSQKPYISSH